MSAEAAFLIAGAGTGAIVSALTIWKWFAPGARHRRLLEERLEYIAEGKPDVYDKHGTVIEEGYASLQVQVREQGKLLAELHELGRRQLEANGGSSMADRVSRIDRVVSDLRVHQQEIEAAVKAESVQIDEARTLAGEAATIADRVDQRHTDDIAQIDSKIDALTGMVEETRLIVSAQLQEAELRAEAMRNIAIELGMPWPEE